MHRMRDCRDCGGDSTMRFVSLKATDKKEKVFTNAVFFIQDEKKKTQKKYKIKLKKQKSFFCPS